MADKKPHETYTLEEFVESGVSDLITYSNFSLLETISQIDIPTENLIFDYMDELQRVAVTVRLTDRELQKYKYKPKLLSYDIYGTTEAYFVIMALNNIIDVRDFSMNRIKMLKSETMKTLLGYIYNANLNLINSNRYD